MVAKPVSAFALLERVLAERDLLLSERDTTQMGVRSLLSEIGIQHSGSLVQDISDMLMEYYYAEWALNSPGKRSDHLREYRRYRKLVRESLKGVRVVTSRTH